MKLAYTVNLGNYENIRIESGEYGSIAECREELDEALATFGAEPKVVDFRKRAMRGMV